MRNVYRYVAMAMATCVIIQASAIAFGMFGLAHDVDSGNVVVDKNYDGNAGFAIHAIMGTMVIPLVAVIFLVVGILVRKVDAALKWAGIVFGLVALQVVLAMIAFGAPPVGLFHGINAFLILLASLKAVTVVPKTAALAA